MVVPRRRLHIGARVDSRVETVCGLHLRVEAPDSVGLSGHATLSRVSSGRPRHVNLTGDLSGEYVVVEERPDGSLVVAPEALVAPEPVAPSEPAVPSEPEVAPKRDVAPEPESPRRPARTSSRAAPAWSAIFGGLKSRSATEPATVPELVEEWGVEIGDNEAIEEFLLAEIDGKTGFVAVTTHRFIFAAHAGRDATVVQEHLLSAARNVELVGRRRRQRIRVTWHGSDSLIWVPDRDAFDRLHRKLVEHNATEL